MRGKGRASMTSFLCIRSRNHAFSVIPRSILSVVLRSEATLALSLEGKNLQCAGLFHDRGLGFFASLRMTHCGGRCEDGVFAKVCEGGENLFPQFDVRRSLNNLPAAYGNVR